MDDVVFTVPGEPQGKGRPRFARPKGSNFTMAYTPEKTVSYENRVKAMYVYGRFPKLDGPVRVSVVMYFGIPASVSKKARQLMLDGEIYPAKKPDADNVCKSVIDALNGIAFDDDKQVVELRAKKMYSDRPRVVVKLHPYPVIEKIRNLYRIGKEIRK